MGLAPALRQRFDLALNLTDAISYSLSLRDTALPLFRNGLAGPVDGLRQVKYFRTVKKYHISSWLYRFPTQVAPELEI